MAQRFGVLSVESKGVGMSNDDITMITRNELQKFDGHIVLNKYDMEEILKNNNIDPNNCLSTECLSKAGELLKVDYMLTGSIVNLTTYIVVNFRLIDVKSASISNAIVREYKNIPNQSQNHIQLTLAQLLKKSYNTELYENLKRDMKVEQMMIASEVKQLNLSGPRFGFTYLFGEAARILQAPTSEGGFELSPLMLQFGYQFEKQYLTSGKLQALFEVIPIITGIEQSTFVPSLSMINGLRNNVNGFEFGIGAVFTFIKQAEVFKHTDGKYYKIDDWNDGSIVPDKPVTKPTKTIWRMDSRGEPEFMTAVVIAVGKSFKSGNMNIPVNFYAMPMRDGIRVGIISGFNTKR